MIWNCNRWLITSKWLPSDIDFSDKFGWLWVSGLLWTTFVGTWSSIMIHGIIVKLVGGETSISSVTSVFSVVSVMFVFALDITQVVWVWGWEPVIIICFDFLPKTFSVTIDWTERLSLTIWWISLLAGIARVIILGRISTGHFLSVLIWSVLGYIGWKFSSFIKNGGNHYSVKWLGKFWQRVWYWMF